MDAASYHAWYEAPRGAWIGRTKLRLLLDLLRPEAGTSLLDLGCGSGWFSAGLATRELAVTGLDPDLQALAFLRDHAPNIPVVAGDAETLPFADGAFDYAAAVTSLCFVTYPEQAVAELWRVTQRGIVLGLLHRQSLLYLTRRGRGGYRGARWDMLRAVEGWTEGLPERLEIQARWAVFLPGGGTVSRLVELAVPQCLPAGGFLAVALRRRARPAMG